VKKGAEFPCLGRADGAPAVEGFVYVTALAEDREQIRWRFTGVLQEELKAIGGGRLLGRQGIAPFVVLDQNG
jgi:hypothetical protein